MPNHAIAAGQDRGGRQAGDPSDVPSRDGIAPSDTVIVELAQGELLVRSLPSAIRRVQERMRELNPKGRLLSDELIADRRAEAARE